jgi:flagellar biosynthesis chaperone FliJ
MDKKQLETILRSRKASEHEALVGKHVVDKVVDTRRENLEKELKKLGDLKERYSQVVNDLRKRALALGNVGELGTLKSYEQKLIAEMLKLENIIKVCQLDLQSAIKRAELAEQEFIEARIESKQVETLKEKRLSAEKLIKEAMIEIESERSLDGKSKK